MDEVIAILAPFATVTTKMQTESLETASMPFPLVLQCFNRLQKDCHKNSKAQVVDDKDLSVPAQLFRKQLKKEMMIRFPFTSDKYLSQVDLRETVTRFVVPSFLNPQYNCLRGMRNVEQRFITKAKEIIKEEMRVILEPLKIHLEDHYGAWKESPSREKRKHRDAGGAANPSKKGKMDASVLQDDDLWEEVEDNIEPEEVAEQEYDDPTSVIEKIIKKELEAYEAKPRIQEVSMWPLRCPACIPH